MHTYIPLKKSIYELVWSQYKNEIDAFMENKFRGQYDINLATFLVPWTGFCEGVGVPATDICYYFNARSKSSVMYWHQLFNQKKGSRPHSFCANDLTAKSNHKSDVNFNLEKFFKL